jgi:glycosyltransferase involved in cell wall biosynthesis
MMQRIIFWQNMPSIHQAPLLREVARQWPGQVIVVAEHGVRRERLALGWQCPDFSPARLIIKPTAVERAELIRGGSAADVHVFSGFHAYPAAYRSLKKVSRGPCLVGVYVEPGWDNGTIKAALRRMRYALHAHNWAGRLDFLLTTGQTGIDWFNARGFPRERIARFGYFVEPTVTEPADQVMCLRARGPEDPSHLIFVGQLAPWKGLDILLRALSVMVDMSWWLDVIGTGAEGESYRILAEQLGIADRVHWLGSQPNAEVRAKMAAADALILPSRYDGWGAVVNEALMAGTRVIVSDACGSSDLVRTPEIGAVCKAASVESLTKELRDVVGKGGVVELERARIREWAGESISPVVAAQYLIEIIEHARGRCLKPAAPWRVVQPHVHAPRQTSCPMEH